MSKRALVTGITGQDGSYLTELLLEKGYEVHGIVRRVSTTNTQRLDGIYRDSHDPTARLFFHHGDMTDGTGLRRILDEVQPDEIYNLAAQSHVRISYDQPEYTGNVTALGVLRLLEATRDHQRSNGGREIRIYQAGSSEMFGSSPPPQNEYTAFRPRSPYAVSKVAAHFYAVNYREAYGMFISNGILFNHEGPRRGENFVTKKITRALTRIKLGLQERLYLGNLDARRDWGFAGDYVRAMWLMLQQPTPDDYVVATGVTHSVKEFLFAAAKHLDLDWEQHVEIDSQFFRPAEVDDLSGDATKAREVLGWKPEVSFDELVKEMVEYDLEQTRRDKTLAEAGYDISSSERKPLE